MSSRWGEEEKKTKGLGSFLLWLGIAGFAGFILYINLDSITKRRKLEAQMQSVVRGSLGKEDTEIRALVAEAAEELGLDIHPGDIEVSVELNDAGNYDVYCRIPFEFKLNFIFTETSFSLPIKEEVTIVPM